MRKKLYVFLALIIMCLVLAGCHNLSSTQSAIYHDNNFLYGRADSYSSAKWSGNIPDKISMSSLTGAASLLFFSVPEDGGKFIIDYDMAVSSGDCKIVLVEYGKTVDIICEGTGDGNQAFSLEQGDYAIKVVGINADVDIITQIQATETITAKVPGLMTDDEEIALPTIQSVNDI